MIANKSVKKMNQSELIEFIMSNAMLSAGLDDRKCLDYLEIKVITQEIRKIMLINDIYFDVL